MLCCRNYNKRHFLALILALISTLKFVRFIGLSPGWLQSVNLITDNFINVFMWLLMMFFVDVIKCIWAFKGLFVLLVVVPYVLQRKASIFCGFHLQRRYLKKITIYFNNKIIFVLQEWLWEILSWSIYQWCGQFI